MTLERFRAKVFETAKYYGQPYLRLDQAEELNELILINLDIYCRRTGCLSSDRVAMTPVVGEHSADFENTSDATEIYFASRMGAIENVFIEGTALQAFDSKFKGASSSTLAAEGMTGYQTAENGRPSYWWAENPKTLRFNCPFDQAYSDCYVSGYLLHPLLETYPDPEDLLLIADDLDPAMWLCAGKLLSVTDREKGRGVIKDAMEMMDLRAAELDDQRDGSSRRQSTKDTRISLR